MPTTRSVLLACSGTLACISGAAAQQLYFADIFNPTLAEGAIKRVNIDGSGLQTVVTTGGGLRSIDVDPAGAKVYWIDVDAFAIRRANLDGSGQEDVISTGLQFPTALRLHHPSQQIYFGDATAETLNSAAFSGGGFSIFTSTLFFRGLTIDSDELFWTTSISPTSGQLIRQPISGVASPLVTGSGKPSNVAVDRVHGWVYFTDAALRSVRRIDLNGANLQTVYTYPGGFLPRGIAVDPAGGKVYWGQDVDDENPVGTLFSMNLDGTDVVPVVQGFDIGKINDIVFVAGSAPPPCYANCDASTEPPVLNVADFTCFLQQYAAGESYANCDASTEPPVLNVADFTCFLQQYAAGCP